MKQEILNYRGIEIEKQILSQDKYGNKKFLFTCSVNGKKFSVEGRETSIAFAKKFSEKTLEYSLVKSMKEKIDFLLDDEATSLKKMGKKAYKNLKGFMNALIYE